MIGAGRNLRLLLAHASGLRYKYTDAELKRLLKSLALIIDTREKANGHITGYFQQKGIPFISQALPFGDYSYMLPACPELGLVRDMHFTGAAVIERKNGLEELSGNLAQHRERFENEFLRAGGCDVTLMIEGGSYADIAAHRYRTELSEKAFLASLMTFEARYGIRTAFVPAELAGRYIYSRFYYHLREFLK